MSNNTTSKITYQKPEPFSLPTVEARQQQNAGAGLFASLLQQFLPVDLIPRESLHYSASVIEECMLHITEEFRQRSGTTLPVWKKYKADPSTGDIGFDIFDIPNKDGRNVRQILIDFFPLIVRDIQTEIDRLISDPNIPDTRASFLARVFANNTTINSAGTWNNVNKLPSSVVVNTKSGKQVINPIQRVQNGDWPFSLDLISNIVPVKGVLSTDPTIQNANISQTAGEIEVTDPNFPQSPYGTVTSSGIPGTKGIKMTSSNLTEYNRINVNNSSLGVGAGKVDPDGGYGYLSSIPHIVHALRYQPPSVETFPNNVAVRQYASNLISNNTPNIAWVESLPIESQILQNWGFWLIKGNVGVVNGSAFIRAFRTPSAAVGEQAQCPFSVFFPPPTANCGCTTGDSSYFIWHSQGSGFTWNELALFQGNRAKPRFFGRNTRLRINATVTGGPGAGDVRIGFFGVGIRTIRVSSVNLQPFNYVVRHNTGNVQLSPDLPDTTFDVNIMEEMNRILGSAYPIGGLDTIESIQLLVQLSTSANWTCDAEDIEGGRVLPSSCFSIKTCKAGDMSATISSLEIYEPALVGDPVLDY